MAKLAINSGKPVRKKDFPSWPIFGEEERKNLLGVFESGKWWYGEKVKEFEEKFATFQDAKYAITCTNGTAALRASLIACGIGAGDEVIVPPYTFVATVTAVLKVNAIPVFADIDIETANIDLKDVKEKITAKTKAIIPVHFAGLPCDMDVLREVAQKYDLKIIEDVCHSWGSKWKGLERDRFIEALNKEGIPCNKGYPYPLYKNPLFSGKGEGPRYCPISCPYYGKEVDYTKISCPNTERICKEAIWIGHTILLAEKEDMEDIVRAIIKIRENLREIG